LLFQSKHKKSENSSYISINYYTSCNLLTTKRGKNAKIKKEEKEKGRRGGGEKGRRGVEERSH